MESPLPVTRPAGPRTSIDKALEVCEVLSGVPRGMSLSDLARALRQPASTVHRLLAVLKRRGYVRQDDETQRYGLTLKMLDLSFRSLGQSELRLHAYPIMREYVLAHAVSRIHRDSGERRSDLPVEHRSGRSGDAHGVWQGDAGPLRDVFFTAAGDAAAELSPPRRAGRIEQARSDGVAAGAAARRAGRAAAFVLHLRAGARLHGTGSGARRRVRPRRGRCARSSPNTTAARGTSRAASRCGWATSRTARWKALPRFLTLDRNFSLKFN